MYQLILLKFCNTLGGWTRSAVKGGAEWYKLGVEGGTHHFTKEGIWKYAGADTRYKGPPTASTTSHRSCASTGACTTAPIEPSTVDRRKRWRVINQI